MTEDNQLIQTLHYSQELTFPFERFITLLQGAINILEDNQEARSEREKVRIMLKKINNVQIQSAILTIAMDDELSIDFAAACNKVSERISIIFPKIGKGRNSYRNISSVGCAYGRGGRG